MMELDMIANLISKDAFFNNPNKKNGSQTNSDRSNGNGAGAEMLSQHMFPIIGNGQSRPLNGNRVTVSSSSEESPTSSSPSSDMISHLLVSQNNQHPSPHLQNNAHHQRHNHQQQIQLQHQHSHHLNNNLLHDASVDITGLLSHQLKNGAEQFDVSNILNMSHINGHLQNVTLASSSHLGNNSLPGLAFSNGHHAAVVSNAGNSTNNANLLTHMQSSTSVSNHNVHNNGQGSLNVNSATVQPSNPPPPGNTNAPPTRSRHRSSANDSMFKCNYCPKKYPNQNALRLHMEECRMIRVHECPQCGKRFKARGGLQQHNRIHLQERPYHCHYCPKRFNQKSHLDQHERIHTGMKPFACQFCGRAFRQRSQQMGHEATHTNASNVLASANSLGIHQLGGAGASSASMVQQQGLGETGLVTRGSERSSLSSEQSESTSE